MVSHHISPYVPETKYQKLFTGVSQSWYVGTIGFPGISVSEQIYEKVYLHCRAQGLYLGNNTLHIFPRNVWITATWLLDDIVVEAYELKKEDFPDLVARLPLKTITAYSQRQESIIRFVEQFTLPLEQKVE